MKKLRLMTIVGTRPEIIKMSAIIKKSDKYFDHVLVHTGQNYDYNLNEVFSKTSVCVNLTIILALLVIISGRPWAMLSPRHTT